MANDQHLAANLGGGTSGQNNSGPGREPAACIDDSPVLNLLREVHAKLLPLRDGAVANYIPELAKVDPDQFGIALVTADGFVYEVGDSRRPFTIQSISKPLVYGLALQDHGREGVLAKIGVEPSGDSFNSIVFDDRRNRPFNTMVNTGAIAATSLVKGKDADERFNRILDLVGTLSGRPAQIDTAVYRSETATGHRNRAIAYLELNNGMIEGDVEAHLDLYFRQCAIVTTAADLAFVAATLARGGRHPLTGKRALDAEHVRDVLSVMTTCGMYDYAGEWELRVGLPAKSGVGGGVMAVLPGQLGIGVFSPRLDELGNPLRGVRACEELSARLQLHLLDYRGRARPAIRRLYHGTEVRSKRLRNAAATSCLDKLGGAICVFEFQGNLFFGNTELAIRRILRAANLRYAILDLGRVTSIDSVAANLLRGVCQTLGRSGKEVLVAAVPEEFRSRLHLDRSVFATNVDRALEHCEDALLCRAVPDQSESVTDVPLAAFPLLAMLTPDEVGILDQVMEPRAYETGQTLIEEGAAAETLYFIASGTVDVCVGRDATRLAAVDAGNVVGELALLGHGPRTAAVIAATRVRALALDTARFRTVSRDYPEIRVKLLAAVGQSLSERLRRANTIIQSLTL